jgi:bile acid:Na+ symporter, BASS family
VFADILLPLSLTLIMGSLGLTLTPADFRRVFTAPRGVGIGLMNLLIVSPFLAFLVADVYGLAATLAVGVVLLGASPGGTTANLLTHLARGDVALSVSMTAVSSVASVLTVPLYLSLGAEYFDARDISDDISMVGVAARVFLITIVPLSIGMLIRARRTDWALRNMKRARTIALVAFCVVVAGAIASEFEEISDAFGEIATAVITLNVLAMTVSFFIARAAKLDSRQSTAIAMELGVHNTTVALAVATSVDDELAGPAAVYGLFMFFTAGLFARFMSRRNAPTEPEVEDAMLAGDRVELSAVVPASPDVVWPAISTGGGITSWFVPTRLDGDEIVMSFGGLGDAPARVVESERPRRFAFAEDGWLNGAPPLLTEFEVDDLGDDRSRVRVVNRVDGDGTAETREALAATETAWRPYLVALRLHLAEHPGLQPATFDVTAPATGSLDEAWVAAVEALGWRGAEPGGRLRASAPGGPELAGIVEHAGTHELVLRLEQPAPGYALIAAYDGGERPLVNVHVWLYGPDADELAVREQAAWEAWVKERFPRPAVTGARG